MKRSLTIGMLAFAAGGIFVASTNATLTTYNWVPQAGSAGTGSLQYDGTSITSYSFTYGGFDYALETVVSVGLLADKNLWLTTILNLESFAGSLAGPHGMWSTYGGAYSANECRVTLFTYVYDLIHESYTIQPGESMYMYGDWVPQVVPEPSTYLAGALLLLPFGASALRVSRKSRKA